MTDYQHNDAMLMEILHEHKTITGFLNAVFGFLRRNTDFYYTKKYTDEKIGFSKGMREQIVLDSMHRCDPEYWEYIMASENMYNDNGEQAPHAVIETVIDCSENVDEVTVAQLRSESSFTIDEYKNGAKFNNYCWSQSLKDVELHILLPPDLQDAKLLSVNLNIANITVRSKQNSNLLIIEGELHDRIKHNDAIWTVAEGKLVISCDKAKEMWWDRFFVAENLIDPKKLDCERYIDELPEDTQAVIERLRVQQMTSIQQNGKQQEQTKIKLHDDETLRKLRKAWNAEGSPFKGQPFNPSLVRFR